MSSEDQVVRRHQQALLTTGFLGGISFTALVLVLQAQAEFTPNSWGVWAALYFGLLVSFLGSTSALLIFGTMVMTPVAAGTPKGKDLEWRDDFAMVCFILGFFGILCSIPLLLLPVNWVAALVVGAVEAILLIVFARHS